MATPRSAIPADWRAVCVSTDRRVFFGWLAPGANRVEGGVSYVTNLLRARAALRWGAAGGPSGLAERGPGMNAVIEPPCDIDVLTGVIVIRPVSVAAIELWESYSSPAEVR